jgi:phosphate transport system permease protein
MTDTTPSAMPDPSRKRRTRTTRPSVKLADRLARNVIRVGGIGTIAAISTVFVFLAWVVWPLLRGEHLSPPRITATPVAEPAPKVLATGIDDTRSVLWAYDDSGRFRVLSASDGAALAELRPFDQSPTAWAFPVRAGRGIFGFADGSIRFVQIDPRTEYLADSQVPEPMRKRVAGDRFVLDGKVAERVGTDQFALRSIEWTVTDPIVLDGASSIAAVDVSVTSNGPASASIDTNGVLRVTQVSSTRNFLTGKETLTSESGQIALAGVAERGLPRWVMLRGLGDNAIAVWEDGRAVRVDVRDLTQPKVAEELDLLPGAAHGETARTPTDATKASAVSGRVRVSAVSFLNGKNTLLVGDTGGGLAAWFRIPAPSMATGDGAHFVRAHVLEAGAAPVVSLASSPRTRVMAAGYADGALRVFHVTSARTIATSRTPGDAPVDAISLVPDDTAVFAWSRGSLAELDLDAPHPEVSWRALLRPVHYEGYPHAEHVWQSSSGTDDFEPKLGLWPLVFGTLKATLYAMLFGVPIALMAAVYTSEFLHPDVKVTVKPTIEMMASLPSVVLGFLAALVLAPMVERSVPEVLAAVVLIPFSLLACAHLWQFVPGGRRSRLQGSRLLLAAAAIVAGAAAAALLGPWLERWLFAGDLRLWLDGGTGDATGGWVLASLPAAALACGVAVARLEPRIAPGRGSVPLRSLVAFTVSCVAAVAVALAAAHALTAAGFDLRGGVVGTYVQRNAMVVGFVMAFAIVPIIYTIAEDALSSIPENLRAGSLALGATPWQTAVRIVIPTAMSGLFSAIMVGLGRAVGETMIVLMAAGNTPVLDWNIFNGFRTLSANIAVELPEAVRDGTHYRTLFLAAFTLFVMTFLLNTAAEVIRQRFRRRAQQL